MAQDTAPAPSRRDRVRAATTQEILQTARRLLVDQGPTRSRCGPSRARWA